MFDEPILVMFAPCICCSVLFASDPDTVPSVWVHEMTDCPIRPDGALITPGEQGTYRAPTCDPCSHRLLAATDGNPRPVLELFPRARLDRINPPDLSAKGPDGRYLHDPPETADG